jgi:hypothetical protein
MGFAGGDTDLYGYVQNNPVNWVDTLGLDGNRLTQSMITIYGLHSRTMPHNDPITNWAKKNLRQGPFNERVNKAQRLSTGLIDLSGINNWQSSLYTSGLIVGSSDGVLLFYVAPEFYFYALSNPYTINEISIGIIDAFGGTAPQTVLGQAIALGSKAGECAGNKIK